MENGITDFPFFYGLYIYHMALEPADPNCNFAFVQNRAPPNGNVAFVHKRAANQGVPCRDSL